MRPVLHELRGLVLGETWSLPLGVGVALGLASLMRELAGPSGWWSSAGGFVLLGLVLVSLLLSLRRRSP